MHLHTAAAMHHCVEGGDGGRIRNGERAGGVAKGREAQRGGMTARAEAIPKALLPRDSLRCDFSRGK